MMMMLIAVKGVIAIGKLIIGINQNLSEVRPMLSDEFIGSDKFIGWLFSV